jgi:hypothetical protein
VIVSPIYVPWAFVLVCSTDEYSGVALSLVICVALDLIDILLIPWMESIPISSPEAPY